MTENNHIQKIFENEQYLGTFTDKNFVEIFVRPNN
jgi:hypothetical protein